MRQSAMNLRYRFQDPALCGNIQKHMYHCSATHLRLFLILWAEFFLIFLTATITAFKLSKTKTPQTVTLRAAILSDFSARRLSQNFGAKLSKRVLRRVLFFLGNLLAQNSHLQCYRLRCFSFAQLNSQEFALSALPLFSVTSLWKGNLVCRFYITVGTKIIADLENICRN